MAQGDKTPRRLSAEQVRQQWHEALQQGRFSDARALYEAYAEDGTWPDLTPLDHGGLSMGSLPEFDFGARGLEPRTAETGPRRNPRRDLTPVVHGWEHAENRDLSVPASVATAAPEMPLDRSMLRENGVKGPQARPDLGRTPERRGLRRAD